MRSSSTSLDSVFHGEAHWREVATIGLDLAETTPACDRLVVALFAALHDAMRIGDDSDPEHGARGAAFARSLDLSRFGLSGPQLALVESACSGHTGGKLSLDPSIGTCWDADRLTLWRVGIKPAARYMSTAAGKQAAESGRRFAPAMGWSEIARRLPQRSPAANALPQPRS